MFLHKMDSEKTKSIIVYRYKLQFEKVLIHSDVEKKNTYFEPPYLLS